MQSLWQCITCSLLLIVLQTLYGCVEVRDHLTINHDGSGYIEMTTFSHIAPESNAVTMLRGSSRTLPSELYYPPLNINDAQLLFPKDQFEFEVFKGAEKEDDPDIYLKVSFKTIDQLLAGPYAKAHGLQLKRIGNQLVLKAFSGLQALADPAFWQEYPQSSPAGYAPFSLDPAKKAADTLRSEFSLTMPAPLKTGNGSPLQQSHTWKLAGPITPAKDKSSLPGLDTEMVAECSAEQISFVPAGPVRPEHYDYANLPENDSSGKENDQQNRDTISSALRFIPIALTTNYNFDYWGEDNYSDTNGELLGAFTLPHTLAPSNWGSATIMEVTDNLGTDLLLSGQRRSIRALDRLNNNQELNINSDNAVYHFTEIKFQSPPINASHLNTIRGAIDLHYDGIESIHKLDDVISEDAISRNVENMFMLFGGDNGGSIRTVSLPEQGPAITFNTCTQKDGATYISMEAEETTRISSLQLYDHAGHHWPGFFMALPRVAGQYVLVIPGLPSPPFSFGLTLNQGPVIKADFSIRNLNLSRHPEPKG